jgi:hypothetical protein
MPILGVIASQISGHLFAPSGAYDSIATADGSGGGATFSSIPQTYKHLQLRLMIKSVYTSGPTDYYFWRLNGDNVSGNYRSHSLVGDGSTASANTNPTGNTSAFIPHLYPANSLTNVFAGIVIDILDYTDTNKYTTMRTLSGYDANGSGQAALSSGVWLNTSAVTSITFGGYNTGINSTYYSYALYGIKGA